jgi:hypothetical protein
MGTEPMQTVNQNQWCEIDLDVNSAEIYRTFLKVKSLLLRYGNQG